MILRSRLFILLMLLLYATGGSTYRSYLKQTRRSINEETLRRLRAYITGNSPYPFHPERGSYREKEEPVYREYLVPQLVQNRREQPQSSYAVEPEEHEIDSISESLGSTEAKPAARVPSLGETAPVVVQDLPPVSLKQQRAPLPYAREAENVEAEVKQQKSSDLYFIALVAGCSGAAVFGVVAAGLCWYKLQKNVKAAAEADYPTYGVTGPSKEHLSPPSGDRKLAQNAQMYHYQHQKQQMIAIEKAGSDRHVSTSDLDSEEENEEGDYTVYECPGLASTGEMEVKNPLFQDETTPASPHIMAKEPEK